MYYDNDKTLCIGAVTMAGGLGEGEREREKNVTMFAHLLLARFYPERNDTLNQVQNILFLSYCID